MMRKIIYLDRNLVPRKAYLYGEYGEIGWFSPCQIAIRPDGHNIIVHEFVDRWYESWSLSKDPI